jgi:hypothetical protein
VEEAPFELPERESYSDFVDIPSGTGILPMKKRRS